MEASGTGFFYDFGIMRFWIEATTSAHAVNALPLSHRCKFKV